MTNDIILYEYFTAQKKLKNNDKKTILKEAIQLSNYIALNLIKHPKIKELHIVRNKNIKKIFNKKIINHEVSEHKSLKNILDNFEPGTRLILVAPETQMISIKLHNQLKKKFILLNSSLENIRRFSSKLKAYRNLEKKKISVVKIEKKIDNQNIYISKPTFGAGSLDIKIVKRKGLIIKPKNRVIQKFYAGKKGSFVMLCSENNFEVLCCNEQIVDINKKKISQTGLIMGGLEPYRKEIEKIGRQIYENFSGLFGFIGVDILLEKNQWKIIEINPRFTSSVIGLEKSYGRDSLQKITKLYIENKLNKTKNKLIKKFTVRF